VDSALSPIDDWLKLWSSENADTMAEAKVALEDLEAIVEEGLGKSFFYDEKIRRMTDLELVEESDLAFADLFFLNHIEIAYREQPDRKDSDQHVRLKNAIFGVEAKIAYLKEEFNRRDAILERRRSRRKVGIVAGVLRNLDNP
jgi:hypothetical protein